MSSITILQSGQPLRIKTSTDVLGSGVTNSANVTCSSVKTFGSVSKWFDTSCFATPNALTLGNAKQGIVRSPGFYNSDFSLSKSVEIREGMRITVQADAFNLANTPHYSNPDTRVGHNLVPDKPSGAPNYWCAWAAQNYMYGHNLASLAPEMLEGESGSKLAHEAMTEKVLFGEGGWVNSFFPNIRKDLYLLLDDGWQVGGTATFELDAVKFPDFTGSFESRLRRLNSAIEGAGWRSTALWCRNTPGGDADQRLENRSESAAIKYWKVDIGDPSFNLVRLREIG